MFLKKSLKDYIASIIEVAANMTAFPNNRLLDVHVCVVLVILTEKKKDKEERFGLLERYTD